MAYNFAYRLRHFPVDLPLKLSGGRSQRLNPPLTWNKHKPTHDLAFCLPDFRLKWFDNFPIFLFLSLWNALPQKYSLSVQFSRAGFKTRIRKDLELFLSTETVFLPCSVFSNL